MARKVLTLSTKAVLCCTMALTKKIPSCYQMSVIVCLCKSIQKRGSVYQSAHAVSSVYVKTGVHSHFSDHLHYFFYISGFKSKESATD